MKERKPVKHQGPKLHKIDTRDLKDDNRVGHPIRPARVDGEALDSVLGRPIMIKENRKNIIGVVLGDGETSKDSEISR